jgi:SAM-dependent methyltransferase
MTPGAFVTWRPPASAQAGSAGKSALGVDRLRHGLESAAAPAVKSWSPTSTPRFLAELATLDHAHIEIRRHDIGTDPLPEQSFDLIHARLVLIHVPARERALERMVTALKSGGCLVVEDFDTTIIDNSYPTADASAAALFQKVHAAQGRLMAARSGELSLTWGRSLYRRLRAHGLVNVDMQGYLAVRKGGSPGARLCDANFEQIREEAVNAGFISNEEVDQVLALLDDPDFAISAPVMFTAWGCRSNLVPAADAKRVFHLDRSMGMD